MSSPGGETTSTPTGKRVQRQPLGIQLGLGLGALIVLIALIGGGALYSSAKVEEEFLLIGTTRAELSAAAGFHDRISSLHGALAQTVLTGADATPLLKQIELLGKLLTGSGFPADQTARMRKILRDLSTGLDEYQQLAPIEPPVLTATDRTQLLKTAESLVEQSSLFETQLLGQLAATEQQVLEYSTGFRRLGLIFTLCGILTAALLALVLKRTVSGPSRRILSLAEEIRRGDLSRTINDTTRDPLGDLSRGIDEMVLSLRSTVGHLHRVSSDVDTASHEIEKYSLDVIKGASTQMDAVEQVSAGVEKMNEVVDSVSTRLSDLVLSLNEASSSTSEMAASLGEVNSFADYTEKEVEKITMAQFDMAVGFDSLATVFESLQNSARSMTRAADELRQSSLSVGRSAQSSTTLTDEVTRIAKVEGVQAIQNLVAVSERNKEVADQYSRTIRSLDQKSRDIAKILDVIHEVAENTNLLSLNAAIIAAQAGENGRSFSVVAEEIRSLARATTTNVKEIEQVITGVTSEVENAVTLITEIIAGADQGLSSAHHTRSLLDTIVSHSTRSADMARTIAREAETQAAHSEAISAEISGNHEQVDHISTLMSEQKDQSSLIVQSATNLQEIARTLRRGTHELTSSSADISQVLTETLIFAKRIESAMEKERTLSQQMITSAYSIAEVSDGNMNLMQYMGMSIARLNELLDQLIPEIDHFVLPGTQNSVIRKARSSFSETEDPYSPERYTFNFEAPVELDPELRAALADPQQEQTAKPDNEHQPEPPFLR